MYLMSIFGKILIGTNFVGWTKIVKWDKLYDMDGVIFKRI